MYYRVEVNSNNIGVELQTPFGLNPTRVRISHNPTEWNVLSSLVDRSLNMGLPLFKVCHAEVEKNFLLAEYLPGIWEVLFERAKPKNIPLRRTECAFFFENKQDALNFKATYPGMLFGTLCEVEIINEEYSFAADMNWLDAIDENTVTAGEAIEAFRKYWAGEKTNSPVMEVLFTGKYKLIP